MNHDSSDPFGLGRRVCVVTGAASGIGRGIATAFGNAGAQVALLDRDVDGARAVLSELAANGGTGIVIECDVSDPASVSAAGEKSLRDLGPCAVLVNNAGMIRPGALESLSLDDWNRLLSVNLTGYFICSQVFGRQMRAEGKGALVHVASIASNHVTPFSDAYSIAKAGVTMLSRQLAVEWGPQGIRSNSVNPGMILTPLSQSMYQQPGVTERRAEAVPVGRIGRPEDVAEAVLFLASNRASYINGDEVTVDGGFRRMLLSMIPRAGYERPVA